MQFTLTIKEANTINSLIGNLRRGMTVHNWLNEEVSKGTLNNNILVFSNELDEYFNSPIDLQEEKIIKKIQEDDFGMAQVMIYSATKLNLENIIFLAVEKGSLDLVKFLTNKYNKIINFANRNQILLQASIGNHVDIIKYLDSKGIFDNWYNKPDIDFAPSFFAACEHKYLDVVKCLIAIEQYDIYKIVVDCKDLNIIKYLWDNRESIPGYFLTGTLSLTSEKGNIQIVKFLLESDRDNSPKVFSVEEINTSFRYSCKGKNIHLISYLWDNWVDFDNHPKLISSGISEAVQNNHHKVLDYLIQKGNVTDINKDELLITAASCGHIQMVQRMVEKEGANIHYNDYRALQIAAKHNHINVVDYLLSKGANIRRIDHRECHRDVLNHIKPKIPGLRPGEVITHTGSTWGNVGPCSRFSMF